MISKNYLSIVTAQVVGCTDDRVNRDLPGSFFFFGKRSSRFVKESKNSLLVIKNLEISRVIINYIKISRYK